MIKGNWFSGAAVAARSWLSYWTSVRRLVCAQLICAFVFENAKSRGSHDTAHTESGVVDLTALWPIRPQDLWGAVLLFIPYLLISKIHFWISIIHFWISKNELWISLIILGYP